MEEFRHQRKRLNAKVIILGVVLAAVAMVPFALQRGNLNQVRAENTQLRAELASANERLATLSRQAAATNSTAANSLSQGQMLELMRLRAEVTALRKAASGAAAPAPVSSGALVQIAAEVETNSPAPIAEGVLTTNAGPFTHAGYSRPADTLSSMVWAMQQGRMDVLLSAATPEAQAELQRSMASGGNPVEKMQAEAKKVLEVRPSTLFPSTENEAYMTMVVEEPAQQRVMEANAQEGNTPIPAGTVYTEGARRIETVVKLQKTGNDWRYAGRVSGRVGHQ